MRVGGVLRIGSNVGVMVGVSVGAGVIVREGTVVTVFMDMAVKTTVGMGDGVPVAASITGTGATCATGAQALMNKSMLIKMRVSCFMSIPPDNGFISLSLTS